MDIRQYYKKQSESRSKLKNEAIEAIKKLDKDRLNDAFMSFPSLMSMRPENGGTLLHILATVELQDDEDVEKAAELMQLLHHWGVDFTATDNQDRRAGGYLLGAGLYDLYIKLGGF